MENATETSERYREYADYFAGESPTYESWARAVADDAEVIAWLDRLPLAKRQPNLVFAAARVHGVPAPGEYGALRATLLDDDGTVEHTIRTRATQTNEAGRLAALLPALHSAAPASPWALLEVGASAGLCLVPDRWGYEWVTADGPVTLGGEPRLRCDVSGPAPLPPARPTVAWRGGIDLNPLDVTDDAAMAWLEALVWPEHDDRRALLREAVRLTRSDPPQLVAGDLLTGLPALVEEAAAYGEVVVFHSAVIAYLSPDDRDRFAALMAELVAAGRCHWVSNEAPHVLPAVTATGPEPEAPYFVLGVDGRSVGWAHQHGRALVWHG